MSDRPSILIVDDQRDVLRLLRHQLVELGFRDVEAATNAVGAMAMLREGDFQIVICDWHMSPMSGLDLLRAIRSDDRLARLHFIMVTGDAEQERVREALAGGVDDFIVKPFSLTVLGRKLSRFVASE